MWGCFLQYKHRESSVGRQGRRDRGLGQAQGGAASWRTHPAPSLRSRFRRSSSFLVLRLKLAARFVYGGDQHPSGRRINTRANSRETAPATVRGGALYNAPTATTLPRRSAPCARRMRCSDSLLVLQSRPVASGRALQCATNVAARATPFRRHRRSYCCCPYRCPRLPARGTRATGCGAADVVIIAVVVDACISLRRGGAPSHPDDATDRRNKKGRASRLSSQWRH